MRTAGYYHRLARMKERQAPPLTATIRVEYVRVPSYGDGIVGYFLRRIAWMFDAIAETKEPRT